ncbi:hypothetical protein [Spirochaeta dissipatitropha]
MTTTFSIRELTRSGSVLSDYDYIEIEDRKSHEYKGVFVPQRYAEEVKQFLHEKIKKDQERRKSQLLQFAGVVNGDFADHSLQELKQKKENQ